jgi:hypothetical protein
MNKLLAATIFGAVAFAAQSAAACDWNREASTDQQQVATTAAPTQTSQPATQAPTATAEVSRPATPTAPVVQVNDRR